MCKESDTVCILHNPQLVIDAGVRINSFYVWCAFHETPLIRKRDEPITAANERQAGYDSRGRQ